MVQTQFDGFWWLLVCLGPLFYIQKTFHKEFQGLLLAITRRVELSLILYSILLLPGVILHELSHFIFAKILLVRTGRISLTPENMGNGRLRLGYVETEESGFLRDALIGFAPLLIGMIFVGVIGEGKLGLLTLWQAVSSLNLEIIVDTIKLVINLPNYWVWFYVTVTVSSTMMPSDSDRRAWFSFFLAVALIIFIGIVVGIGPFFIDSLLNPLNKILQSIALVCTFSIFTQGIVLVPIKISKRIIARITGVDVHPVPN
jgi:hypothetical protein